jgi:hypothetical protein
MYVDSPVILGGVLLGLGVFDVVVGGLGLRNVHLLVLSFGTGEDPAAL